jgi:hypothetical protein
MDGWIGFAFQGLMQGSSQKTNNTGGMKPAWGARTFEFIFSDARGQSREANSGVWGQYGVENFETKLSKLRDVFRMPSLVENHDASTECVSQLETGAYPRQ